MSVKRLRAAFMFNEVQARAVVLLSALMLLACFTADPPRHWGVWIVAIAIWPSVAVLGNVLMGGKDA